MFLAERCDSLIGDSIQGKNKGDEMAYDLADTYEEAGVIIQCNTKIKRTEKDGRL